MLLVISTAGYSLQIVEATVAPNFTTVPILLHFLRHAKKVGPGPDF